MADPLAQDPLPEGIKHHPSALDDVPADWADMHTAGTPYLAIVAPMDGDATKPKLLYTTLTALGVGLAPVTIEDGSGGFEIVFTEGGDVVYS